MTSWQIKLPVRDPGERLDARAVSELPDFIDDPDDRLVTGEWLRFAKEITDSIAPGQATIALVSDLLEDLGPLRKALLDYLRRRAGLNSVRDEEQLRSRAAAEAALPDPRPLRLAYSPSGSIIDLNQAEDEAARQRALAATRAAQRQAAEDERAAEAERARRFDEAVADDVRAHLPPGVPG